MASQRLNLQAVLNPRKIPRKKAVKSVVDEYVSGNQEIDPGKSYTFDEKVAFIDKAAQENPKVKQALVDWANATNEYTFQQTMRKIRHIMSPQKLHKESIKICSLSRR